MTLDWDGNIATHNRENGTNHKTRKELVSALYTEHGSCKRAGDAIYISSTSFLNAMVEDKIPRQPRGHQGLTPTQQAIFDMDTKDMTRREIAEKAGAEMQYAFILLKRYNKPWIRIPKEGRTWKR